MPSKNLSTLKKDELKTIRKSRKERKEEINFLENLLNVSLKTFEVLHELVGADHEFTRSQNACFRISYRIFGFTRCALNSLLEGYYDVSTALLRIAYENHLLLHYLSENEEEAILWFKGKTFDPSFLRKKYHSKSSHSLYRWMSESIHSSFKSTLSFTMLIKDEEKAMLGEYDPKQFKQISILMIMNLLFTIIWLSVVIFPQELGLNEEWRSVCWDQILKTARYIRAETSTAKETQTERKS